MTDRHTSPGDAWAIRMSPASPATIVARLVGRGSRVLVAAIEGMIADGALVPGQRLPSIRALAHAAGMSPTTVSDAWRELHRNGMLHTEGRRGTHVSFLARQAAPAPWRLQDAGTGTLDLSSGSPDPALLPEVLLAPDAIAELFRHSTYYGPVVEPALEDAVRDHWGDAFRPQRLTVVDGSLDALDRLMALLLAPGDVVAMEEPAFPPLVHLLHRMRCVVREIDVDGNGPRPAQLHLAIAANPRLFVYQPRAQNPTGASVTAERVHELAEVLHRMPDTVIIELDSAGAISQAPLLSLASFHPHRVIRVHGFSKSHAPDLRLAAVGGPPELVERLEARRLLGPGWSSRALQSVLAHLLRSPSANARVSLAREVYAQRSRAFTGALRRHGFDVADTDGFNVWVPVHDAMQTARSLARAGTGIAIGRPFQLKSAGQEFCRVTVSTLPEHAADDIAALMAASQREPTLRIVN